MGRLTSIKSRIQTVDTRCTTNTSEPQQEASKGGHWAKTSTYGRLTGRPWRRLRDKILARDLFLCQCPECAKRSVPLPADEVDHIIPLAEGGTDAEANLQAMNHDCHELKTRAEAARTQGR